MGRDVSETGAGTPFILSLGSNMGDRLAHLEGGIRHLARAVSVEAVSIVVESPVWPPAPPQPDFLNLVLRGRTDRDARGLLELARSAERSAGRVRSVRRGPRTLDVDIIFFGSEVIDSPELRVPHPRWSERPFVFHLVPEVAGEMREPGTGERLRDLLPTGPIPPGITPVAGSAASWRIRTGTGARD